MRKRASYAKYRNKKSHEILVEIVALACCRFNWLLWSDDLDLDVAVLAELDRDDLGLVEVDVEHGLLEGFTVEDALVRETLADGPHQSGVGHGVPADEHRGLLEAGGFGFLDELFEDLAAIFLEVLRQLVLEVVAQGGIDEFVEHDVQRVRRIEADVVGLEHDHLLARRAGDNRRGLLGPGEGRSEDEVDEHRLEALGGGVRLGETFLAELTVVVGDALDFGGVAVAAGVDVAEQAEDAVGADLTVGGIHGCCLSGVVGWTE